LQDLNLMNLELIAIKPKNQRLEKEIHKWETVRWNKKKWEWDE
jgi:hypothetical protein